MTDLTDRMRTCAAHMLAGDTEDRAATTHAIDLLLEASDVLDAIEASKPLGEPMALIPPVTRKVVGTAEVQPPLPATLEGAVDHLIAAGDILEKAARGAPPGSPRPRTCPKCDSRAAKRARVEGRNVILTCPACAHQWPYVSDGRWV